MNKNKKLNKRFRWYHDSFKYLKESRNYIYAVAWVFLASAFIGFIFSSQFGFIDELLKELIDKTQGLSVEELIWFIFTNNLTSSFLAMVLGFFLGIFSLFNSFFNGILLGYVYSKASGIAGFGIIWKIAPHGVFELPAIFISLGMGVKLGMFLFAKEKKKVFIDRIKNSMKTYICIVIPLLLIAAIIEGILIGLAG
jgi:stage II sporulation protein M